MEGLCLKLKNMISPILWGSERGTYLTETQSWLYKVNPRTWVSFLSVHTVGPHLVGPVQTLVSQGPFSAAQVTFSICWPGFRGDGLQLVWDRKTVNLFKLSAWPICFTFSTVMNENRDKKMFHKMGNSKRIRKMQNKEVCDLFLLLKRSIFTELLDFFFFLPLSSVTHSPVQPRYFGFFSLGNQWVGEYGGAKS